MSNLYRYSALAIVLLTASCTRYAPPVALAADSPAGGDAVRHRREVLVTGIMAAVHSTKILVPQIWGQGGPMTLTKLIPNGSRVKEGDLIAVFDSTQQSDLARDANAKFEDLGHQVRSEE